MKKRIGPTNNFCYICRKVIDQPARGRLRLTCSDACKQARWRFLHGARNRRSNRLKKAVDGRRAKPFVERNFGKLDSEPVLDLSDRRNMYECLACGQPYIVERLKSGAPARPYCSDACEAKSRYHWNKFLDAYERAHQRGELTLMVRERLAYSKLSPLCPECGTPFAPNTTLHGKRKRGRPRKYCSDACRRAAFEQRWKNDHHGRARRHRFRPCANCGRLFDCTNSLGRRSRRHCSEECSNQSSHRAETERNRHARRLAIARRSRPARLMPLP